MRKQDLKGVLRKAGFIDYEIEVLAKHDIDTQSQPIKTMLKNRSKWITHLICDKGYGSEEIENAIASYYSEETKYRHALSLLGETR